jgi:hypothetical protein
MGNNTEYIQSFAKKLIKVDSSVSLKEVTTIMISEEISYLPIIDNKGKKNIGVYKRKELFEWLIKNPNKNIDDAPKEAFLNKKKKLPYVDRNTSLSETMIKLRDNSAILLLENNEYTHLITPRVVANALDVYSSRFMVFENLEKLIRKKIIENKIDLEKITPPKNQKPLSINPEQLEFGQYITVFGKRWVEMNLSHINKKTFDKLLRNANTYRNALMHFRLIDENKGLEDANKLIKILN